ncbi:MAG: hypothetical protein ACI9M1_001674 [Porticoccaceae bacterium]|jgi:hypothetical protein
MKEQIKKFLNEEQDSKAIEKITSKLNDLLMKNEDIGYIGVQKKPALTVFPDSIVMTNKRIIICQPKNLGLSMDFTDYSWDDLEAAFVKENILGSVFSFSTKTDMQISIDYIPKTQARKMYTFAKEQMDLVKTGAIFNNIVAEEIQFESIDSTVEIEEMDTEEVTNFAEIVTVSPANFDPENLSFNEVQESTKDSSLSELSQDALFEKLQNYKKLLDNGLILQGEYDLYKKDILSYM